MNVWKLNTGISYYEKRDVRRGLRLRFDSNIDIEVKRSCKEFGNWLRYNYIFPFRVPVYIKSSYYIKAMDGDKVSATFFQPYDKLTESYIKIAAGDYYDMLNKWGKDQALGAILHSIAHELTHYFQWINDVQLTDIGYERQASMCAKAILDEYSETREHP